MQSAPDFHELVARAFPADVPFAQKQYCQYLELVWYYGEVFNLTAFKGPQELLDGLVTDSLRLLELGPVAKGAAVADLGSGNGSPVVPLAIRCPQANFTAIEANRKRSTFLQTVTASLGLANLKVAGTRVEQLVQAGRRYDLVTSRAFAPPFDYLETALRLVRPGGEIRGFTGFECASVTRAALALGAGRVRFSEFAGVHGPGHVWSVRT
jgi:16S rRNA (guanine527-N7)-methyltransferase